MRFPIRARLTLTFAILMALVLIGVGLFLYLKLDASLNQGINQQLAARARGMVASIAIAGPAAGGQTDLVRSDEVFAEVVRGDGTVLDSSPSLRGRSVLPSNRQPLRHSLRFESRVLTGSETVAARFLAVPATSGLVVIVGTSLQSEIEALARLRTLLWAGGPGALVLTTAIIWFLAGAALRPVERMRAEAAAISVSEPDRKLPVPETGDEIERLGRTLNDLLDRMHLAFDRERRFVDDASHELRTPLGILRTEIELALRRSRSTEELEAALRNAGEQSDRLIKLSHDLLVLARADRRRLPVHKEPVALGELIGSAARELGEVAAQKGVSLRALPADGEVVTADPDRMHQALRNLIENAIRHTPAGGSVTVSVMSEDRVYRVAVADTGPGFPEGFIGRAFDPFTRDDFGRSRREGGTGLGLAIVKAIAEAHGGAVAAENRATGGAVISLSIPR
ncbi:MAG: ATP-binding protein [Actinomycetota bacterium]|nr:ATP-binding protein [Actinomycetota bacterium]